MASYLSLTKGGQEVEISPGDRYLYMRVTPTKQGRREFVVVPNSPKARLLLRIWKFRFAYDPLERMRVPCTEGALFSELLRDPGVFRQIGP
jgi:hypothetical protein